MKTETTYKTTADRLVDRIKALIPAHPEILSMSDLWELFKVEGFKCNDIGPSLFQASWALAKAKAKEILSIYRRERPVVKIGEKYVFSARNGDPFAKSHTVTIQDVRDGWCKYDLGSTEISTFLSMYRRIDE